MRTIFIIPFLFMPCMLMGQSETGGVADIFSYGAGLRALGMGGAFTAMKKDPTLAYWNPGAMPFNQYKEITLFGTRSIANSYYAAGFYTNPTTHFGTLSLGAMGVYTGGIESYDETGSPITASDDYLHYQFLLSYGYNFSFGLGLGATAKVEQMRITDYKGTGASFDAGVFYNPPGLKWLSVGAVVQNIYGTGLQIKDEYEPRTRMYKLGLSTNFLLGEKDRTRLSFAADSRFYTDNYNPNPGGLLYDFSLGTELSFNEALMFRVGYSKFTPQTMFQNLPLGLTAGITIRQFGLGIDYAVSFEDPAWQGTVEMFMRIGVSFRFGKSMEEKKALEAQKIQEKIEQGIREATQEYENRLDQLSKQYQQEKQQVEQQLEEKYQQKIAAVDERIQEVREDIIADLTAQKEAEKRRALEELQENYQEERAQLENQLSEQRLTYQQRIENLQEE
ncbi:MAG: PorV/PorQ family protein, partial [Spirochaetota bacterium]